MPKPGRTVAADSTEGGGDAARLSARRQFLGQAAASVAAVGATLRGAAAKPPERKPVFKTRGVVLVPSDITTWDWPEQARRVGLSTIATHVTPSQVAAFVKTDKGQAFLERCRTLGLEVEHELHALRDLLPRGLFARNPEMFRMNRAGQRVADWNLCVHSNAAVEPSMRGGFTCLAGTATRPPSPNLSNVRPEARPDFHAGRASSADGKQRTNSLHASRHSCE